MQVSMDSVEEIMFFILACAYHSCLVNSTCILLAQ